VRRPVAAGAAVVVKVGSSSLAHPSGGIDDVALLRTVGQVIAVRRAGYRPILVSSGAVAAGLPVLGMQRRPRELVDLQVAAAVGQGRLMEHYARSFGAHDVVVGQVLLTRDVLAHRSQYLHARETLLRMLAIGVVPVVNENDTVSIDEIKFGDNDQLAAMVTNLLPAPLLVVLTSVDGLYDGPPGDPKSRVIPLVETWDDRLLRHVDAATSSRGRGGMGSKLQAIRMATAVGENVIVANGTRDDVLDAIREGHEVGTLFLADGQSLPAWKRWIGYTVEPRGKLVLDAGACRAIVGEGRSLLAIGIARVVGQFERGQVVALVDDGGREVARGLVNYDAHEVRLIRGRRTAEIPDVLGSLPYAEVVHRDNLVVTGEGPRVENRGQSPRIP
jgi:glutamate 5-kinase